MLDAPMPPEAAASRKTVLQLGWMSATPGRFEAQFPPALWQEIRYDCDARVQPDIHGPLERLDGVADATVDAVMLPQVLQRFPLHLVAQILKEALRVLKDEGCAILTVPNAQLASVYVANNQPLHPLYDTKVGAITPLDLLYGLRSGIAQGEPHFQHRSGFTHEQLGGMLRECGFTNIAVQRKGYEITAVGFKFPYGHPERVERIAMGPPSEVEAPRPPQVPRAEALPGTKPLVGANGLPDDLDLPPAMWKPLGLRQ
jgi:hypothetical protein